MTNLTKGSALPRSLSESERVYLAPSQTKTGDMLTVAIREGAVVRLMADFERADVKAWSRNLQSHAEDVTRQLDALAAYDGLRLQKQQAGPEIMGIVNVTPDSFSDGGQFDSTERAIAHARKLAEEGATILDFGGESTRPGADLVEVGTEIKRIVPVIERAKGFAPFLSADTRKAEVMDAAIQAGANMINDVTALEYEEGSLQIAARNNVRVCLMHSSADPKVMQDNPSYDHVLFDVIDYLKERIAVCENAGLDKSRIIVDPGIGFGKTVQHNLVLLKGLHFFHSLGCLVLLGASRKSFIGKIDQMAPPHPQERIGGSLSAVLMGLRAGVQIFRVHDVAQTRQAIAIWRAMDDTSLID